MGSSSTRTTRRRTSSGNNKRSLARPLSSPPRFICAGSDAVALTMASRRVCAEHYRRSSHHLYPAKTGRPRSGASLSGTLQGRLTGTTVPPRALQVNARSLISLKNRRQRPELMPGPLSSLSETVRRGVRIKECQPDQRTGRFRAEFLNKDLSSFAAGSSLQAPPLFAARRSEPLRPEIGNRSSRPWPPRRSRRWSLLAGSRSSFRRAP
jgi:hypothetical protein